MLQNAKHRAKRKGIPFSLVREDIVIPTHCPVLGIELSTSNSQKLDNSASLDRIDNSKGYVPGNVHVISLKANQIKNNATPAELRSVAQYFEDL